MHAKIKVFSVKLDKAKTARVEEAAATSLAMQATGEE